MRPLQLLPLAAFFAVMSLPSCNWAGEKAKTAIHKSGEAVASAGSEFADGVSNGVKKSFKNELRPSAALKTAGLSFGTFKISSANGGTDNVLSVYVIYEKDVNRSVRVRLVNTAGEEYGRMRQSLIGNADQAGYVDFSFDPKTTIAGRGTIYFE
jgi:hypothetical protein